MQWKEISEILIPWTFQILTNNPMIMWHDFRNCVSNDNILLPPSSRLQSKFTRDTIDCIGLSLDDNVQHRNENLSSFSFYLERDSVQRYKSNSGKCSTNIHIYIYFDWNKVIGSMMPIMCSNGTDKDNNNKKKKILIDNNLNSRPMVSMEIRFRTQCEVVDGGVCVAHSMHTHTMIQIIIICIT